MSRNASRQFLLLALLVLTRPASAVETFPPPIAGATARVVVVQGENFLSAFLPDAARVETAFNRGLTNFTRTAGVATAWCCM